MPAVHRSSGQMLQEILRRRRQFLPVTDAERQSACRPVVGEEDARHMRGPAAAPRGRLRHDAEAHALRRQAADALEAAHAHPHPEPHAALCSLHLDVVLQGAAREADEVLVHDVRKGDAPALAERMIARDDENQPVDREGHELQSCRVDRIGENADLGEPRRDGLGNLRALPLLQLDVDPRMRRHPLGEPVGQELADSGGVRRQPDRRPKALRMLAELAAHLRHLAQDQPRVVRQRLAGFGRGDATPAALEQPDFADGLHVAQALAGGGQRQADICGAARDAAGIHDGEKQAEIGEIEAHAGQLIRRPAFGPAEAWLRIFRIVRQQKSYSDCTMDWSLPLLSAITATFLAAGLVKGVTGMGLPTVAMALLGSLISPLAAAGLLIVPSFVTNVWQLLAGPSIGALSRRLWPMMLAIAAGTVAGSSLLASGDARLTTRALGAALVIYAAYTLLARHPLRVPARLEPWLSPLIGAVTGMVTGGTGVFVIPAVPYLQALGLDKDELVQALGLSFTVSTGALAAGLAWRGALPLDNLAMSTDAVVPALAGMWAGQIVRRRISPATFRRFMLLFLLLLGAEMLMRPPS